MPHVESNPPQSRWPHWCAWALACATFPLIWWGGFVTATGAGMAFRDWLTSDGSAMPIYPWFSSVGDKFIEHGHRLLGLLAGILAIALAIVCWRCESRGWVRYFSLVLLAGVVLQGALGGMRVLVDAENVSAGRTLALVHGCTGPLFLTLCAMMIVVTSRSWRLQQSAVTNPAAIGIGTLAGITALISYLQLIVGAVLRHSKLMLGEQIEAVFRAAVYFHLLLAAAVVVHICLLAVRCWRRRLGCGSASLLAALVVVQTALGVATWISLYGMPRWATLRFGEWNYVNFEGGLMRSAIVTAHGAVGALIVAIAAAAALSLAHQGGMRWKRPTLLHSNLAGALA